MSSYPQPPDMHHLGGSAPGEYYSHDQRAMYEGGHEAHNEKGGGHTGMALAGGAALGVVGGAWAAHEYGE